MRALLTRYLILSLLAAGCLGGGAIPVYAASGSRVQVLRESDRATLLRYARDTWKSFEELELPSGLPADGLTRTGNGWTRSLIHTSPTNIGAYLWSVLAAERLRLITPAEARARLDRTLTTLGGMERTHGFFVNELDPRTGVPLKFSKTGASPRRLRLSAIDNAWLAVALWMIANVEPDLRSRAEGLLKPMDFRFFYDAYEPGDPVRHPGQLRVGYRPDDHSYYGHYGMLNTEARIGSYLGIARGQLPAELYYRMFRTLPKDLASQEQPPRGETRAYRGVKVFEGCYDYRGARIVPSWGGSMFEALMVTLFVPEDAWAPKSWGLNHPLYVRAQMKHGVEAGYGFWGFSPAASPRWGYGIYGVDELGTSSDGYYSYDPNPPGSSPLPVRMASTQPRLSLAPAKPHGIVTPYASFLALRYTPREAIENLNALTTRFPIYSPLGFLDSVDVSDGMVAGSILSVDQGMIMAAIANELEDDVMQHAFCDGQIEKVIRPLIAEEEFFAGLSNDPGPRHVPAEGRAAASSLTTLRRQGN
jgi:hypothetical protein